jgi:hypothetical protein
MEMKREINAAQAPNLSLIFIEQASVPGDKTWEKINKGGTYMVQAHRIIRSTLHIFSSAGYHY